MDPTPKPKPEPEPERLEEFINLVNVNNPSKAILEGIAGLHGLLSDSNRNAAEAATATFSERGLYHHFVQLMSPPADSPIMTESSEVRAKIINGCVDALNDVESLKKNSSDNFMEHKDKLLPVLMDCVGGQIKGAMNDENNKLKLDIATSAVWLLSNVAADNSKFRDILIDAQFHVAILQSLQMIPQLPVIATEKEFMRTVTWALSNFCRGKPEPDLEKLTPLVEALPVLFKIPDTRASIELCWAVSYIADNIGKGGKQTGAHLIVQSGIINLLLQRAFSPSAMAILQKIAAVSSNNTENVNDVNLIQIPVVRTIGSLMSSDDDMLCDAVLQSGTLPMLVQLLSHPHLPKSITLKKDIAWALSNVAAGTPEQVQALVKANAVPPLLAAIMNDSSPLVKKEALYAISNLTLARNDDDGVICQCLVSHNVIGVVAQILPGLSSDEELCQLCQLCLDIVDGLIQKGKELAEMQKQEENLYVSMVQEAGLFDTIRELQSHKDHSISELSSILYSEKPSPKPEPERVEEFIKLIDSRNPPESILEGITGLHRLLSDPDTEAAETANATFVQRGLFRNVVELMLPSIDNSVRTKSAKLRAKILDGCLGAMTSITVRNTCEKFMDFKDALFPVLMNCLEGKIEGTTKNEDDKLKLDIATRTATLLGNVAVDNEKFRDILIDAQFHVAILQAIQRIQAPAIVFSKKFLQHATRALMTFCRKENSEPDLEKLMPLVETVPSILQIHYDDTTETENPVRDFYWAIAYFADCTGKGGKQTGAHLLAHSSFFNLLVQRAFSPLSVTMQSAEETCASTSIVLPVVRMIASILSSEDEDISDLILRNVATLRTLIQLLSHPNVSSYVKKEIAYGFSNVVTGARQQAQVLIDANAVPPLLAAIMNDPSPLVKKEALFAIANLTLARNDDDGVICQCLVSHNVIGVVAQILPGLAINERLCQLCLEIVDGLLQKGKELAEMKNQEGNLYVSMVQEAGLLETIEELQSNENETVVEQSACIIDNYFTPAFQDDS